MAGGILALVLSTSITTLQRAQLSLDSARCLETASRIMQCEMEKERLLSWTQVTNSQYQPVIDASFLRNPAIAGRFTLSRTVADVPDRSGQMVQITLTTTWQSTDGRTLSRNCCTYYGKDGLYVYFTSQS